MLRTTLAEKIAPKVTTIVKPARKIRSF